MTVEKIAVLRVARMSLASIRPHPRNPRAHPKPGSPRWEALRASLAHDYFDPLVVNERNGMLVSGRLRHSVLVADGFVAADVSVVDYDEGTHFARMIAANNLLGDWESDILASLARELEKSGMDAGLAGWSEKDLAAILEVPDVTDDTETARDLVSKADELLFKWQVVVGDLYVAGEQRILCGDCTSPESWRLLLGDQLADVLWGDPPYNVNYADLINDDLPEKEYAKLLSASFKTAAQFLKKGAAFYVAHAESYGLLTRQALAEAGFHVSQCLVWVKSGFVLGRQDFHWQHEPILYGWKPGAGHYWQGGFSQATVIDEEEAGLVKLGKSELIAIIQRQRNERGTTVIREPKGSANGLHPTIKPLALVARQIWSSSQRGETVLEPFGGSGTTAIAAAQTGRRSVTTELDPKYCAVILERLTLAGLKVEKISDAKRAT